MLVSELVLQPTVIKVAVCGIVNAGKSTLLNALQDQVVFETGVVRTTKKEKAIQFSEDIELIDLPGLDANEEDNAYTLHYFKKTADVFLLVHNGQEGELNAIEMKLFNQVLKERDRVLVVHTHMSNVDKEEKNNIEQIITQQLNRSVLHFYVDSLVYQKGVKENKKLLQEAGGVDLLKQALLEGVSVFRLSLEKEKEAKKRLDMEQYFLLKQQQLEAINQGYQMTEERLKYVEEALTESKKFKNDITIKIELSGPGTISLSARRSNTSKHSSESAVESEAERIFHEQFVKVYDLIDLHKKKWTQTVRESIRYEQANHSLSYQLEKRMLQRLRQLHHLGESYLSDLAFEWKTIQSVRFSFDEIEQEKGKVNFYGYPSESWESDLMSSDHYVSCNVNIYESIEYRQGFFGKEKEVSIYDGSFSAAFRELNGDLLSISREMQHHYEGIADEELAPFKARIETHIGTVILELQQLLEEEKTKLLDQLKDFDQQRKNMKKELKELQRLL